MNIPELPIQLVAVTDSSAGNFHQTAELNQILVAEVIFLQKNKKRNLVSVSG